jgi:transcription elongation factor GreA
MLRLSDPVVMTAEGLKALQAELEQLETVARREIAERIKTAREWGDLKENSEYHDAKNDQAHLETRIARLRQSLTAADVRETASGQEAVGFGSRVEVRDETTGRVRTYVLVSPVQSDPGEGRLSIESPIGRALAGARPGQTVAVPAPRGERRVTVVAIG